MTTDTEDIGSIWDMRPPRAQTKIMQLNYEFAGDGDGTEADPFVVYWATGKAEMPCMITTKAMAARHHRKESFVMRRHYTRGYPCQMKGHGDGFLVSHSHDFERGSPLERPHERVNAWFVVAGSEIAAREGYFYPDTPNKRLVAASLDPRYSKRVNL
jgi:hypothetical protein